MTLDKEINGRYVLAVLPSNKAKEIRDSRFDLVWILIALWYHLMNDTDAIFSCRKHSPSLPMLPSSPANTASTPNPKSLLKPSWTAVFANLSTMLLISNLLSFPACLITSLKGKTQKECHAIRDDGLITLLHRYKGDGDLRFELSFNISNQKEMVQLACELPDVLGGLTMTPEVGSSFVLSYSSFIDQDTILDQEPLA